MNKGEDPSGEGRGRAGAIELEPALAAILERVSARPAEPVDIRAALGRVCAAEVTAMLPHPGYDQSTRDGYVIGATAHRLFPDRHCFRIAGEIAAGTTRVAAVRPGEAYRIMTGGMIPSGGVRVVVQEQCRVRDGEVEVPLENLAERSRFIEEQGAEIAPGAKVCAAGTTLLPGHVALLATTGHGRIEVFQRPRVAYLCSGSELVDTHEPVLAGQKISSNRYLLDALIRSSGAESLDGGAVRDEPVQISTRLAHLGDRAVDIIVSTGGMGPGKFDLMEKSFEQVGGQVLFRSLAMRPGRSTVFGMLGEKLYFGLPGPPFAVAVLFNEIICPAIRKMQGSSGYRHVDNKALLAHDVVLRGSEELCIKEGIGFTRECRRYVRFPGAFEMADSYIHFPAGTSRYRRGDEIIVHHAPGAATNG